MYQALTLPHHYQWGVMGQRGVQGPGGPEAAVFRGGLSLEAQLGQSFRGASQKAEPCSPHVHAASQMHP